MIVVIVAGATMQARFTLQLVVFVTTIKIAYVLAVRPTLART